MELGKDYHVTPEVSIRWITIACFEIRVGDFRILIDPCVGQNPNVPYGAEVLDKADLILISHGHWDHITDLQEMIGRSDCPVLCGELTAADLCRVTDCNPAMIYPVTPDLELDFGAVKVKALFARHKNQHKPLGTQMEHICSHPWINTPEEASVNFFGSLEYRDYLITTPSGLKIMFWGSNVTPEQIAIVAREKPDIAFLQYSGPVEEGLAELVAAGGIKTVIPHHMDLTKTEEQYWPRMQPLEDAIHAKKPDCLVIFPRHLQWYHFGRCAWSE